MRSFRNIFLILFVFLFFSSQAYADGAWVNDLKTLFTSNNAIIYVVNIRTFNAKDKNGNGIIEENLGEEKGTFLNAIDRLDELKVCGVNTILVMPITPVGKIKALGTAGSLYSASSFNEINPQLKSPKSTSSIEDEMKMFINECHNRKIRVIVDLPSCGSFDLYLKRPELFVKDRDQNPVIPADWTDVRLLNAGSDSQINMDVYNMYAEFVDSMLSMDVDGIRADFASIKPYSFWKKLIDETKLRNPQFLFLAGASPLYKNPSPEYAKFTPYNRLLDAGFDGYYGSYSDMKNWKSSKDLISAVESDIVLYKKYSKTKSVVGSFATHDQVSPILVNGVAMSKMIIWLNATLPVNAYYIDGFSTGDTYIYPWTNKKAATSETDDDYYFTHRGQIDIFNQSRMPNGGRYDITRDFILANRVKTLMSNVISNGSFVNLKTSSPSVFAYARSFDNNSIIVIGNLDFKKTQNVTVNVPKISNKLNSTPIKTSEYIPKISNGKVNTDLAPGEVEVFLFNGLDLK